MRRVGKHSARGSQEGRDRPSGQAGPGSAPGGGRGPGSGPGFVEYTASGAAPGTGRRRRVAPGTGADPGVTPPQGVPRMRPQGPAVPRARGGHPEHREPGGGWGALGAPSGPGGQMGPGGPVRRGGGPGGVPGGARASFGARTAGPPAGAAAGGLMPGPRKEYVDAFDTADALDCDGEDVFAAGAPGAERRPRRTDVGSGAEADADDGAEDEPQDVGGKGGKGRTFTGVAAAAVTTVLAVVVAGQVANGPQDGGNTARAQGGAERTDAAGDRDDGRAGRAAPSTATPSPKATSYDALMARQFPLDPKLSGSGAFTTVSGQDKGTGRGRVWRYRVDVEKGLPLDGELFAKAVHKTLNDDRSWAHAGMRSFDRVSSGRADFVITLASPGTTADWCLKSGLDTTQDNVSCDSASTERVMINAYRWAQGAKTFGDDKMHAYRQMLINHEVGHRLGHNHEACTRQGALAPVMMQQTKFLSTDGATCRPNAWPYPAAASGGGTANR
ncbi:DUF3152 domain-containing protein [Streptomyces sp. NPDC020480]|uniref:DUF3152 domain-containing protein n=2 Tax=unclassified Streptomyces TaxID=2593676 RepID=UPI003796D1EA